MDTRLARQLERWGLGADSGAARALWLSLANSCVVRKAQRALKRCAQTVVLRTLSTVARHWKHKRGTVLSAGALEEQVVLGDLHESVVVHARPKLLHRLDLRRLRRLHCMRSLVGVATGVPQRGRSTRSQSSGCDSVADSADACSGFAGGAVVPSTCRETTRKRGGNTSGPFVGIIHAENQVKHRPIAAST